MDHPAGIDTSPDARPSRRERILVVDDEPSITELVSTALRFVGFEVREATTGQEALDGIPEFSPHLVILDVMLPDLDGFEVCRRLRATGERAPVIFLTARDELADKVRGFTGGGDDYITKPFSLEELVVRIRAVLRRTQPEADITVSRLTYADLELDEDGYRVWRAGQQVHLSPTEFRLLRFLMANAEHVLSRYQIIDGVWAYDFDGDPTVVETYISYLRKKVDHVEPKLIQTVRGFGYSLRRENG